MRLLVPALMLLLGVMLISPSGARSAIAQSDGCRVDTSKTADPIAAIVGHEVAVTMRVDVDCARQQLPIHAAVVVDTSAAMGGQKMAHLRTAVAAFVDALDMPPSQAGLVSFASAVEVQSELTTDRQAIKTATQRFFPRHGSNLLGAVRSGHQVLKRGRGGDGDDVLEVLLVISGSEADDEPAELIDAADTIKADGVLVVTVAAAGFADATTLEAMASSSAQFFVEGQGSRYASLLEEIAEDVSSIRLTSALVTDELAGSMEYVWGSGVPAPRMQGKGLTWTYATWPAEGITITYGIEPTELGAHAVSRAAEVELTFDRGAPLRVLFSNPTIQVVPEPTTTPTPAATVKPPTATSPPPTATATPRPTFIYLPVLLRQHCAPRGTADVVFVIDTSYSMMYRAHDRKVKLELVQIAATDLAWALEESGHRAAVVTFADRANLRQELTDDRLSVEIALSRIYDDVAAGSRIDLGLGAAFGQYLGPDADPGSLPVVVLITDGYGAPNVSEAAAAELRDFGVVVHAIGIGSSVSQAELSRLSSASSTSWHAGSGATLGDVYASVGQAIDCAVRQAR